LYRGVVRPGTNDSTFIPGSGSARYKCETNTFVPSGATTRYKSEAFVLVGRRMPRHAPVRGHLYRAMAPTSTNVLICTNGKNTRYK
jgi:hypothetical protein